MPRPDCVDCDCLMYLSRMQTEDLSSATLEDLTNIALLLWSKCCCGALHAVDPDVRRYCRWQRDTFAKGNWGVPA